MTTHALSAEQIEFFDRTGYLILRDRVPAHLVADLRLAADRWISDGRAAGPDSPDHRFTTRSTSLSADPRLFRVDYLHAKHQAASLALLGSPAVLGIAESLAGPDFVPTYESLVFKDAGDGAAIDWHQDAVHPRAHRIFNVDVYLDASRAGQGALRVLPGSQRSAMDICALRDTYGWEPPESVQVELEAGDVLVHDVMIVHGSEPVRDNPLRRTIYYEFRPAAQILDEGPWDREWVDARLRLLPPALAEHARRHPEAEQFDWRPSASLRPVPLGDDEVELRVAHAVHTPGTFCSAGDVAR